MFELGAQVCRAHKAQHQPTLITSSQAHRPRRDASAHATQKAGKKPSPNSSSSSSSAPPPPPNRLPLCPPGHPRSPNSPPSSGSPPLRRRCRCHSPLPPGRPGTGPAPVPVLRLARSGDSSGFESISSVGKEPLPALLEFSQSV